MSASSGMELGPVSFAMAGISRADRESFAALLSDLKAGMERIQAAANRWVEFSEETREKFREASPPMFSEMWVKLERIGNGMMHPLLYSLHGRGAKLLSKMPVSEQTRWLNEGVPVLIVKGRGTDELRVSVEHLSAEQQLQVFKVDNGGVNIRSLAEQRAWMAQQAQKKANRESAQVGITKIERPHRWRVEKGRAWIHPDKVEAGLTKADVTQLLRDLQQ